MLRPGGLLFLVFAQLGQYPTRITTARGLNTPGVRAHGQVLKCLQANDPLHRLFSAESLSPENILWGPSEVFKNKFIQALSFQPS